VELETIVWYVVVGAIVGILGRLVVPGKQSISLLLTIVLGIVGAVVGGLIAGALGLGQILTIVIAVLVAALLVYLVAGNARTRRRLRL
jgi:uncharacterized membrane protein YeaQ/YmgE (transglycosylase-associated protein family)